MTGVTPRPASWFVSRKWHTSAGRAVGAGLPSTGGGYRSTPSPSPPFPINRVIPRPGLSAVRDGPLAPGASFSVGLGAADVNRLASRM